MRKLLPLSLLLALLLSGCQQQPPDPPNPIEESTVELLTELSDQLHQSQPQSLKIQKLPNGLESYHWSYTGMGDGLTHEVTYSYNQEGLLIVKMGKQEKLPYPPEVRATLLLEFLHQPLHNQSVEQAIEIQITIQEKNQEEQLFRHNLLVPNLLCGKC